MEPTAGQGTSGSEDSGSAEFFIPDLCASPSVFVMVLLAELMVIVHVLTNSALPQFNWDLLASSSLIVQWVVLLSAALLCQLRGPISRLRLPLASLCSLLLVVMVTIVSSYFAVLLIPQVAGGETTSWWLLRNALVAAVVAGIVLRYFYLQHQLRRQEKLELQARLDSLRARIRPHFLFNTLNSIASLIASRPEAAEQAVEDLSDLFRASLQESSRSTTVADEMRLCELYLGIEQLRLGDRLKVEWQVADSVLEQPMPSLMLQPLVENAIYHGISRLAGGGKVTINVAMSGGSVTALVENPVDPKSRNRNGHQIGIDNIEQRLNALYGTAGTLQVSPSANHFRVILRYPREMLT